MQRTPGVDSIQSSLDRAPSSFFGRLFNAIMALSTSINMDRSSGPRYRNDQPESTTSMPRPGKDNHASRSLRIDRDRKKTARIASHAADHSGLTSHASMSFLVKPRVARFSRKKENGMVHNLIFFTLPPGNPREIP